MRLVWAPLGATVLAFSTVNAQERLEDPLQSERDNCIAACIEEFNKHADACAQLSSSNTCDELADMRYIECERACLKE